MANPKSDLGWLLAVVFAGTTALFAWQFAQARTDAATVHAGYAELQQRLAEQEQRNQVLLDDMQRIQQQLDQTVQRIEMLQQQVSADPQ